MKIFLINLAAVCGLEFFKLHFIHSIHSIRVRSSSNTTATETGEATEVKQCPFDENGIQILFSTSLQYLWQVK